MTDKNVSLDFHIATGIEEAAGDLKVCRTLMEGALQFCYSDAEGVRLAQGQLFFLVKSLGELEKRLDKLQAVAYGMGYTEQVAA